MGNYHDANLIFLAILFFAILSPATLLLEALQLPPQALLAQAATGGSEAADAQCSPVITQCGCGMVMKNGKCSQTSEKDNMHSCTCEAQTPVGPVKGVCVAANKCQESQLPEGQSTQLPPSSQTGQPPSTFPLSQVPPLSGQQSPLSYVQVGPDDGSFLASPLGQLSQTAPTSGIPDSDNPISNETTGQSESQPLHDDQTLYPMTIFNEPNQPGVVFNETTGQWEGSTARTPNYPMPVLPDNPANQLLQTPGAVPTYSEGDQNYQFIPQTDTFNTAPESNPDNSEVEPSDLYFLNQLYSGVQATVARVLQWVAAP